MRKFEVANMKCANCEKLIKNSLKEHFGEVKTDVAKKTIELDCKDEKLLYEELEDIGFPVVKEII